MTHLSAPPLTTQRSSAEETPALYTMDQMGAVCACTFAAMG
eukprot:CAMPEP_0178377936 /NCGR_PEP_ID=MMETSP0689_2-20121128/4171_1 /TAXON_ID=160604 /ORGANISM="Amphidinium massartii, Strain CS-259" /LENGTH=40 /DNA_ID= /DNA_START= /DNA_END= /DNA_ORIENTATION=